MEEFEVKGPEEEVVEKHVEHESGHFGFASKVALLTAILSTLGAFYSYHAGKTLSDAMIYKNQAGIYKTEAANQWAYYQAKSTKQAFYEGALITGNYREENKDKIEVAISHYEKDKKEITKAAQELEKKSLEQDELSEKTLHHHHQWAQATTAIQIAISLAAITILTRKKWLFWTSLGVSIVGVVLGVVSFFH